MTQSAISNYGEVFPMQRGTIDYTLAMVAWYEKMVEAFKVLTDEERLDLQIWEKAHIDQKDISNWPGWERHIGAKPKSIEIEVV
jgi:hypothetical protein